MTETPDAAASPKLDVNDTVLAKIAAFEAAQTPGVARLHPYAVQAARQAVNTAAKRATAKLTGAPAAVEAATAAATAAGEADPAAVDVDHDADSGTLTLTIRIVATTEPPVLRVVRELQQRVNSRITELTDIVPVVIVNVLDIDPPAHP